jgi:N6-adenosine-specific RNA methylase IME4
VNDLILAKVDKARQLLAQAANAREAKKVMDLAEAAKIFAKRQKLGQESIDYAHAIVIDAQTCMGEFLRRQEKNKGAKGNPGGRGNKNVRSPNGSAQPPTLKELGVSFKESSNAQFLAGLAKLNPVQHEQIRSNKKSVAKVRRQAQRIEQDEQLKKAQAQPKPIIVKGPYDVVMADPPWRYDANSAPDNREIENHYPTATLEEIFTHIQQIPLAKDCRLFLWATAPKLKEAFEVMEAWGFKSRSGAVWDKLKIGMGYWWRIQHEHLLIGVRGRPEHTPELERVSSIFRETPTVHSAKPQCVYQWIERAFPEAAKLEMYCRGLPRPGWAAWGNQTHSSATFKLVT